MVEYLLLGDSRRCAGSYPPFSQGQATPYYSDNIHEKFGKNSLQFLNKRYSKFLTKEIQKYWANIRLNLKKNELNRKMLELVKILIKQPMEIDFSQFWLIFLGY